MNSVRTVLAALATAALTTTTVGAIGATSARAAAEPPTEVQFYAPGVQGYEVDGSGDKDVTHSIYPAIRDATEGTVMTYAAYTCAGDQIAGVTKQVSATDDLVELPLGAGYTEFKHGSWIVATFKAPNHSVLDMTQQFLPNDGGWNFEVCVNPVKPSYGESPAPTTTAPIVQPGSAQAPATGPAAKYIALPERILCGTGAGTATLTRKAAKAAKKGKIRSIVFKANGQKVGKVKHAKAKSAAKKGVALAGIPAGAVTIDVVVKTKTKRKVMRLAASRSYSAC